MESTLSKELCDMTAETKSKTPVLPDIHISRRPATHLLDEKETCERRALWDPLRSVTVCKNASKQRKSSDI